jgi:hypothetical protein
MTTALEKLEKWIERKKYVKDCVFGKTHGGGLYIALRFSKIVDNDHHILNGIECDTLNISHNKMTGYCQYLRSIKCRSLDISLCWITDDDCKWIKDIKCSELNLDGNYIGDCGIELLKNNIYSRLYIRCNGFITQNGISILKNMKCRRIKCENIYLYADTGRSSEVVKSARKNWYVWSMNDWIMTDVIKVIIAEYCCGESIKKTLDSVQYI